METPIDVKKVEVTYDSLNAIKYHLMKDEFEKLGIGTAFKGGAKKEELIEAGLATWKALKDAKKADEAKAILELVVEENDIPAVATGEEVIGDQTAETTGEEVTGESETTEDENTEGESPKYSREILEKAYKSTKANIANGIPSQRNALLKKLEWIEAELENCED